MAEETLTMIFARVTFPRQEWRKNVEIFIILYSYWIPEGQTNNRYYNLHIRTHHRETEYAKNDPNRNNQTMGASSENTQAHPLAHPVYTHDVAQYNL